MKGWMYYGWAIHQSTYYGWDIDKFRRWQCDWNFSSLMTMMKSTCQVFCSWTDCNHWWVDQLGSWQSAPILLHCSFQKFALAPANIRWGEKMSNVNCLGSHWISFVIIIFHSISPNLLLKTWFVWLSLSSIVNSKNWIEPTDSNNIICTYYAI